MLEAVRLLTALPVPRGDERAGRWTPALFPLVGLLIGFGWVLASGSLHLFPRTTAVAAALILVVDALLTGARHLRGLADAADELTRPSDHGPADVPFAPSMGATGAVAVNLVLLVRFGALLFAAELTWTLMVVPLIGRAALLVVLGLLPTGTLGVAKPTLPVLGVGGLLAVAGAALGGPGTLLGLAVALVVAVGLGGWARHAAGHGASRPDAVAWGAALIAETAALLVLLAR